MWHQRLKLSCDTHSLHWCRDGECTLCSCKLLIAPKLNSNCACIQTPGSHIRLSCSLGGHQPYTFSKVVKYLILNVKNWGMRYSSPGAHFFCMISLGYGYQKPVGCLLEWFVGSCKEHCSGTTEDCGSRSRLKPWCLSHPKTIQTISKALHATDFSEYCSRWLQWYLMRPRQYLPATASHPGWEVILCLLFLKQLLFSVGVVLLP